jgi:hypothetical protein
MVRDGWRDKLSAIEFAVAMAKAYSAVITRCGSLHRDQLDPETRAWEALDVLANKIALKQVRGVSELQDIVREAIRQAVQKELRRVRRLVSDEQIEPVGPGADGPDVDQRLRMAQAEIGRVHLRGVYRKVWELLRPYPALLATWRLMAREYAPVEIARLLGVKKNTAQQRVCRVRTKIKEALGGPEIFVPPETGPILASDGM